MPQLKDIDKNGIAYAPHAYFVDEILLTNAGFKTPVGVVDIQGLVTEVTIIESIYSPNLICQLTVRDPSNLIETLPIYGFETISIKMRRQQGPEGEEQIIDRLFYITEYPVYGKGRNEHVQVYTMKGVSYHAWKNPLLKISRFYDGLISDEIAKIAKDAFDLNVIVEGEPEPKGRGVINVQSPLQAIDWFRRRTFDPFGAPFYFYETLQNKENEIFFSSHSILADKPIHGEYFETRLYGEAAGTQADYDERKVKITSSASNLNVSKFLPISSGTWASENNYLDIATRTFRKSFFNYKEQFPLISTIFKTDVLEQPITYEIDENNLKSNPIEPGDEPSKDNVNVEAETISTEVFSHREHVSLNSQAYYDELASTPEFPVLSETQNYMNWATGEDFQRIPVSQSFHGIFNALTHDVTLYGDFELNAGKTIDLYFPKSIDPTVRTDAKAEPWDANLSGKYIVVSVIHQFKDQEYHVNARVKRDSTVQDAI